MKMPANLKTVTGLLITWLALFAVDAHAALENAGVFDSVLDRYSSAASSWGGVTTAAASWLFWTLVLISMVWTFGMMALRKADLQEFFAEFLRFTIFTGFFWWLLSNGPAFASSIYSSMRLLASKATGLSNNISPSGIVDVGFAIWDKVADQSSVWSPVDSGIGMLLALAILVILALVGVNMLLLLCSAWVLAYGGVFFLGFGGSRWTSDMAINYYKTALGVGAQLFSMVLLVGIAKTFLDNYYGQMSEGISLKEMSVMLIVAVVLLGLTDKIPPLLAGIITGASVGSGGIGNFGAGAAFGAAMNGSSVVANAASMAGAAAMSSASSIGGGASAIMAAFSKASENVSAGTDIMSTFSGAGGSGDGGTGYSDGDNASTGDTPFAQAAGFAGDGSDSSDSGGSRGDGKGMFASAAAAMSKAGRIAADAGANLAKGTAQVSGEKAASMREAAAERIADTTGGKIAAAINAQGSQNSTQNSDSDADQEPSFDGNSAQGSREGGVTPTYQEHLSGRAAAMKAMQGSASSQGRDESNVAPEVANFVNRSASA